VNVSDDPSKKKTGISCMLSVCEQATGCKCVEDAEDGVSDGRHAVEMASMADGGFCGKYDVRGIWSHDPYVLYIRLHIKLGKIGKSLQHRSRDEHHPLQLPLLIIDDVDIVIIHVFRRLGKIATWLGLTDNPPLEASLIIDDSTEPIAVDMPQVVSPCGHCKAPFHAGRGVHDVSITERHINCGIECKDISRK
jgi:hypothetical protein